MSPPYRAEPATATAATATASMGRDRRVGADRHDTVGTQQGEHDHGCQKGIEAATTGMPARWAVASCSGMTMAASVMPATRSSGR